MKAKQTAHTKKAIENIYQGNVLHCTRCLKPLTPSETWLPNDMRDGRIFCFDCAPEDAIRAKDII